MRGKKAFLRTMEALIAAVLAITVLFAVMPRITQSQQDLPSQNILEKLSYNESFRSCALDNDLICINESAYNLLPIVYQTNYVINLSNNPNFIPANLPEDERVYAESLFIAGNLTDYNPVIVKLYYWS